MALFEQFAERSMFSKNMFQLEVRNLHRSSCGSAFVRVHLPGTEDDRERFVIQSEVMEITIQRGGSFNHLIQRRILPEQFLSTNMRKRIEILRSWFEEIVKKNLIARLEVKGNPRV